MISRVRRCDWSPRRSRDAGLAQFRVVSGGPEAGDGAYGRLRAGVARFTACRADAPAAGGDPNRNDADRVRTGKKDFARPRRRQFTL